MNLPIRGKKKYICIYIKQSIMKKQNRKTFLATITTLGAGLAVSAMHMENKKNKMQVIHHVFFWLKNPDSKEDLQKLIEGLRTLKKIETVKKIHIGVPASTELRPVVDGSYSASELLFFDDLAGQNTYQDHPIHLEFLKNCSHLWDKVIVYDSVDV